MKKKLYIALLCIMMTAAPFQCAFGYSTKEFYALAGKHRYINPFAVTVQSACETGNWTSYLWKSGYNGAGLKASAEWLNSGRPYLTKESPESRNGVYTTETSKFRKYMTPQDFLKDYEKKIKKDYPRCARNRDNIWGYFAGLYAGRLGKWATDHNYYKKLTIKAIKLAPEIYGAEWKIKLTGDFSAAVRRRSLTVWQKEIIREELDRADQ